MHARLPCSRRLSILSVCAAIGWLFASACSDSSPTDGGPSTGDPDTGPGEDAAAGLDAAGLDAGGLTERGGPVELSGVFNARHTGGLPTAGGQTVRPNVLIRSGHLADLDATGCEELHALQIRSVVDLREAAGPTGTSTNPDADCATADTSYYQADIPKILPPPAQAYLDTLHAAEPDLAAIFALLAQDEGLPAIVHCVIGRDRANIVTDLVLMAVGVSADDIMTDFLTNQNADVLAQVQAEWMQVVLDEVAGQGGIEAYLEQHGVTAAQITKLEELLLE